jgi:hypothetical protein
MGLAGRLDGIDQIDLLCRKEQRLHTAADRRKKMKINEGPRYQDDMGWPDLLVSDAMVMMAADDCRG